MLDLQKICRQVTPLKSQGWSPCNQGHRKMPQEVFQSSYDLEGSWAVHWTIQTWMIQCSSLIRKTQLCCIPWITCCLCSDLYTTFGFFQNSTWWNFMYYSKKSRFTRKSSGSFRS